MTALRVLCISFIFLTANGCVLSGGRVALDNLRGTPRAEVIARSQVWTPTDVSKMDLKRGPAGKGAFAIGETVPCTFIKRTLDGNSPKFACQVGPDDEVKVKFGGANGEVYGEVAATRVMWALGFGADQMYPVRVVCNDCPEMFGGTQRENGDALFDPAVIERKMPGEDLNIGGEGWAWSELDLIDEDAGGAPRSQRDALKLLAVMLQHTDSKPQQQRLVCLDAARLPGATCGKPFMMISDVGLTFGQANRLNTNARGSVNFWGWAKVPVWKDPARCVGNLRKSFTGTLENPVISEQGRAFLADLLMRLSDAQLTDLFEVARVELRPRTPGQGRSGYPSVTEWVDAFKQKRAEIASHRCAPAPA